MVPGPCRHVHASIELSIMILGFGRRNPQRLPGVSLPKP